MVRSIVLGFVAGLSCAVASAREPDGQITFYTYYLKEQRTVRYRDDGRILPEGLKQIEKIFRSRDSDALMPVDIRLLDLLDRIEDHFGVRQVEVISGYRSQAFNKELKAAGHSVANESFHTKGMAADIHLDEITEEALKDFALSLGAGGVGYYPSLDMVHVDVGPVRTWGEDAPRKTWIGEKNAAAPVTLTVAPTQSIGEKRLESLRIEGTGTIRPEVEIQFFDRGQWPVVGKIDVRTALSKQKEAFLGLPFGKFRLKATIIDSQAVTSPQNAEKLPRWGFGGESGFSPEFEPKHPAWRRQHRKGFRLPVRGGLGPPDRFQYSNEFYFKRK